MTLEEKIVLIAEAIDIDKEQLKEETPLAGLEEWDSMGTIAVIAMLDRRFDVQLAIEELTALKTIGDIVALMAEKK
jgi:acyl carrier protein